MSKYKSNTSSELLATLARWQESRLPEDAEFLADQMPNLLQDLAKVKTTFFTLREKVALLEQETKKYREGFHQRQLLIEFDDEQKH